VIEQIERLGAELEIHPFAEGQPVVLKQREIYIDDSRREQNVPR
jgi:hypothetical protein